MRSYLFVPGDQEHLFVKAAQSRADAIILDLEDAVAPTAKDQARRSVHTFLRRPRREQAPKIFVRIDSTAIARDVRVLAGAWPDGIVLAKSDVTGLSHLHTALAEVGEDGRPPGLPIIALIESATGLLQLEAIARAPNVDRLMLGEIDLAADLGLHVSDDARELLPLRLQVVVASAAAGLRPPIGPVWPGIDDAVGFERATNALLRQGFRAGAAIHPKQLDVLNEIYTPAPAEVARANRLVALYEESLRAGVGAINDAEFGMIDRAVVRTARDIIARSGGMQS